LFSRHRLYRFRGSQHRALKDEHLLYVDACESGVFDVYNLFNPNPALTENTGTAEMARRG